MLGNCSDTTDKHLINEDSSYSDEEERCKVHDSGERLRNLDELCLVDFWDFIGNYYPVQSVHVLPRLNTFEHKWLEVLYNKLSCNPQSVSDSRTLKSLQVRMKNPTRTTTLKNMIVA